MRIRRVTSASERARFVSLRACGMSLHAIARVTGVSTSTVFRWVQRWLEEDSVSSTPSQHSPLEPNAATEEGASSPDTPQLSMTWEDSNYRHPQLHPNTKENGINDHSPSQSVDHFWQSLAKFDQHLIFFLINYQRLLQVTDTKYLPQILEHVSWSLNRMVCFEILKKTFIPLEMKYIAQQRHKKQRKSSSLSC